MGWFIEFFPRISEKFLGAFSENFQVVNFWDFSEEIENGRIEKMNYGYREQKLSELGVNDKTFEQA